MPAAATKPKGPGGRPKKAEHERRVKALHAEATVTERAFVDDQAKLAGVSHAEYVRRRCLGVPVVSRQNGTDPRLIRELNAIGVNLNQISRNVNADRLGGAGSRLSDLDALQRQLRDVLDKALEDFDD